MHDKELEITRKTLNAVLSSIKINELIFGSPAADTEMGAFVHDFMLDADYSKGSSPAWDIQSENHKITWLTAGAEYLPDGRNQER